MSEVEAVVRKNDNRRRSESRKRTATVSTRLLPAERQAMDRAAEAAGLAIATWARETLLKASGAPVPPRKAARTDLARAVGRWTGQIGQIGNLLNQLTRYAHHGGLVDPRSLQELTASVRELHTTVTDLESGGEKAGAS
ncbi:MULTISPECIES: plasmid mobilization relaxosome protein MobC [unclassified Roseibium]|uniref:plasmid mobilization protein n=1 Tax=unclassified Roseibium TaxID=2629323 RepID=UPI00273DB53B|nr:MULTISPECIES: plasmid mobilization relaxosome protein MobC [unclassified Roseibium]